MRPASLIECAGRSPMRRFFRQPSAALAARTRTRIEHAEEMTRQKQQFEPTFHS
jgi:hypothetical protein